ncbi:MAG: glycosyltransferase family 1 protein [Sporolactobacillus sp.]
MSRDLLAVDARKIHDSGIGTYITHVLPLLTARMQETDFCLLGDPAALAPLADGERVTVTACRAKEYSLAEQVDVLRAVPRHADLLWVPHYNIPYFYRGRMIVTVHDAFHLAMPQYVGGALKKCYARTMFRRVQKKAARIVTISQFSKQEIIRLSGCPAEKIRVIYNGVGREWFEKSGAASTFSDSSYIVYVGNVKPHKNLKTLIQAFNRIKSAVPHKLLIIGQREGFVTGESGLEALTGADGRIAFTGRLSDQELRRTVSGADLLVLPSLYEGFGLPPLEAMACGTAVAASDIPPVREACGECAAYFNPHDAEMMGQTILQLLTDREARERLVREGNSYVRRFTWEQCAAELQEEMVQLMPGNGGDRHG